MFLSRLSFILNFNPSLIVTIFSVSFLLLIVYGLNKKYGRGTFCRLFMDCIKSMEGVRFADCLWTE